MAHAMVLHRVAAVVLPGCVQGQVLAGGGSEIARSRGHDAPARGVAHPVVVGGLIRSLPTAGTHQQLEQTPQDQRRYEAAFLAHRGNPLAKYTPGV